MNKLILQIRSKMNKEGLTPYSLERNAGLKPNAVHNIISGRSKNPSISVLTTIAKTLNCTVSDLIGENSSPVEAEYPQEITSPQFENQELYVKCLLCFCSILNKHKTWLPKQQLINCVDEIYLYSAKKNLNSADLHFANWFFEKIKK